MRKYCNDLISKYSYMLNPQYLKKASSKDAQEILQCIECCNDAMGACVIIGKQKEYFQFATVKEKLSQLFKEACNQAE